MTHAILLAAGRSRRMGTQKLLLPFAGRTVVGHIAGQLAASAVGRIVAVVGPDAAGVVEALAGLRVQTAVNGDAEGDMLSSVRCGLRALPEEGEAVVVALGDQPTITAELIDRMIEAFAARGRGIVVPAFAGRRGHPILFSMAYRQEVLTGLDGVGLRGLLAAHDEEVFALPAGDPAVLCDMDCPEDYRKALSSLLPRRQAPSRRGSMG
jgi:molybdenum cofactor cytidylyltransferase